MQLHRLVFSLRFSKEERLDLDRVEEEKARNARRKAEQKTKAIVEKESGKDTNTNRLTHLVRYKYSLTPRPIHMHCQTVILQIDAEIYVNSFGISEMPNMQHICSSRSLMALKMGIYHRVNLGVNSSNGRLLYLLPVKIHLICSILSSSVDNPPDTQSGLCRLIGWFCGVGGTQAPEPTEEEVTEASKQIPDIREDPVWRNVVDANALVMMTVAIFFWGYYA